MSEIIRVSEISKTYKVKKINHFYEYFLVTKKQEISALKNISISIDEGEAIALLGLNGAGKSTLIKCIVGLLYPDKGNVEIFGKKPSAIDVKKKISVVFGQRSQLRWDLSVKESILLIKKMYNVSDETYKANLEMIEKYLRVSEIIDQPVRTLSLGQKMRAELFAAFVYNPEILILDEPTIGLDIFSKELIIDFLKVLREKYRTTIILTTHDIDDVEKLCDRIIILKNGELLVDEKKENLLTMNRSGKKITFSCSKVFILDDNMQNYSYREDGRTCTFLNIPPKKIVELIEQANMINTVIDIKIEELEFEDVFKHIVKES